MRKYNYKGVIYKIGDKVLLTNKRPKVWNKEGLMDRYLDKIVTISKIYSGGIFEIEEDTTMWKWSFRFNEIVKKVNDKHFKSYPNNYTGILNIENGCVKEETKKEILDKEEKEYFEAVLKPFKDKVTYIRKEKSSNGDYYIYVNIDYIVYMDALVFPNFSQNSKMYAGMELNKKYTLKELGLFEEE